MPGTRVRTVGPITALRHEHRRPARPARPGPGRRTPRGQPCRSLPGADPLGHHDDLALRPHRPCLPDAGVPVAAICGATAGLAREGLLDDRARPAPSPSTWRRPATRAASGVWRPTRSPTVPDHRRPHRAGRLRPRDPRPARGIRGEVLDACTGCSTTPTRRRTPYWRRRAPRERPGASRTCSVAPRSASSGSTASSSRSPRNWPAPPDSPPPGGRCSARCCASRCPSPASRGRWALTRQSVAAHRRPAGGARPRRVPAQPGPPPRQAPRADGRGLRRRLLHRPWPRRLRRPAGGGVRVRGGAGGGGGGPRTTVECAGRLGGSSTATTRLLRNRRTRPAHRAAAPHYPRSAAHGVSRAGKAARHGEARGRGPDGGSPQAFSTGDDRRLPAAGAARDGRYGPRLPGLLGPADARSPSSWCARNWPRRRSSGSGSGRRSSPRAGSAGTGRRPYWTPTPRPPCAGRHRIRRRPQPPAGRGARSRRPARAFGMYAGGRSRPRAPGHPRRRDHPPRPQAVQRPRHHRRPPRHRLRHRARAADDDDAGLTRTGALVGSPGFMAPEQVRGDRITPACDVFCLGSVVAYAATGELPFGTANSGVHALMFRIAQEEPDLDGVPESIADLVRDLPEEGPRRTPRPHSRSWSARARRTRSPTAAPASPGWPSALVAQLGRHAVRLLDMENPEHPEAPGAAGAAATAPEPDAPSPTPTRPPKPDRAPAAATPDGPPPPREPGSGGAPLTTSPHWSRARARRRPRPPTATRSSPSPSPLPTDTPRPPRRAARVSPVRPVRRRSRLDPALWAPAVRPAAGTAPKRPLHRPADRGRPGRRAGRRGSVYALMSGDDGNNRAGDDPTTAATAGAPSTRTPVRTASAPTTEAGQPTTPTSSTPQDGTIPTAYLGTWDDHRQRLRRPHQAADHPARATWATRSCRPSRRAPRGNGTYHCVFEADLSNAPDSDGPLNPRPSKVTVGPAATCTPGRTHPGHPPAERHPGTHQHSATANR